MIAVVDAQYWIHHRPRPNGSSDSPSGSGQNGGARSQEPPGAQTSLPLVVGPALRRSVADAASSYRAAPPVRYELDYSPGRAPRAVGLLLDVLAEDAPCPAAGCGGFDAWKSDVAAGVREYVPDFFPRPGPSEAESPLTRNDLSFLLQFRSLGEG
jgi:hypothetical protein